MVNIKFPDGALGKFDKRLINSTKIIKVKKSTSKDIWSKEELLFLSKFYFEKGFRISMKSSDFQKICKDIKNINTLFKVQIKTPTQIKKKLEELDLNFNAKIQKHTQELKILKSFHLKKKEYILRHKNISQALKNFQKLNLRLENIGYEAEEGKVLTALHYYKERDKKIVEAKKLSILAKFNKLSCEACNFNFDEFYGERGNGYIECHHLYPVSQMSLKYKTKLDDLCLLCSNSHRIIHRKRPWLTLNQLKDIIKK